MIKIHALAMLFLACISLMAEVPLIVAHRGSSFEAPGNTIPAFSLAWKQSADAIEGDFHLTRDGEIVCIHDRDTKKVSGTNLVVSTSTLAELQKLDVSANCEGFTRVTIPTIAEVFATIPQGKQIYIEIKCGPEIIPALLDQIDKSGLTKEQAVIISFKANVIQELKANAPHYKAFWLCRFKKQKTGELTPSLESVLETLKLIQADGLSSNTAIPHSLIAALRKQGYQWHVWTVDDPKTARRMAALGAKSITTNKPDAIRKSLAEQPLLD
jgi:glycerophosphoryl diester phosphodiesterase